MENLDLAMKETTNARIEMAEFAAAGYSVLNKKLHELVNKSAGDEREKVQETLEICIKAAAKAEGEAQMYKMMLSIMESIPS